LVRKPNVLVLLADEHSPLALGCYGSDIVKTPNLDALATRGVSFRQAYCQAPMCVPSRLSFLTGQYSWRIGAWSNASPVPTEYTSLPEHLRRDGYYTAAIGKMHFLGDEQLWGFQHRPYGDFLGDSHQPDPLSAAPRHTLLPAGPAKIAEDDMQETIVNRLAIELLRTYDRPEPFCLWLSYNRPHFPVRPPQRYWDMYYPDHADLPDLGPNFPDRLHPWMQHHRRFYRTDIWTEAQVRQVRAGYYSCVTFVDDKLGEVLRTLDELGLRENTIVLYFTDHGDMNGEHGMWRKGNFYDPSARVPLIISYPTALPEGKHVDDIVELADIFPTVAEMVGAPAAEGLDGRSLVPLMTRGSIEGRKGYAISESYTHGCRGRCGCYGWGTGSSTCTWTRSRASSTCRRTRASSTTGSTIRAWRSGLRGNTSACSATIGTSGSPAPTSTTRRRRPRTRTGGRRTHRTSTSPRAASSSTPKRSTVRSTGRAGRCRMR